MNFIIYDLEATCWMGRPPYGVQEIIEVGAVKLNMYGDYLSSFNRFVQPMVNPKLSRFCKRLTSIRQEDVNRASLFDQVAHDFIEWIDSDDYLLCSWGEQDIKFLQNDCKLHKIDTDWLAHHADLKEQYYKSYGLKNPVSLSKALDMEGYEFEGVPHRAISDAQNLVRVFRSQIDIWVY